MKLLVTSATLDGEKFSAYFNNCPVSGGGRQSLHGAASAAVKTDTVSGPPELQQQLMLAYCSRWSGGWQCDVDWLAEAVLAINHHSHHAPPPVCGAQVFNVPGRCFPVDIIHSQDDHMQDYAAAAIDTALQIHLNQPEG